MESPQAHKDTSNVFVEQLYAPPKTHSTPSNETKKASSTKVKSKTSTKITPKTSKKITPKPSKNLGKFSSKYSSATHSITL